MPSARFNQLKRRIARLERNLLPAKFTAPYTQRELDQGRAYLLLVRAELEAYFEDRARSIVEAAFKRWQRHRRAPSVLLCLLSFHKQDKPTAQMMKEVQLGIRAHPDEPLFKARQAYHQLLSKNHGIREANILEMLLPIGVKGTGLDAALIGTLDSFGQRRGKIAHTAAKIQTALDPAGEVSTINNIILLNLALLDEKLDELGR
jgi:hypothetical protein